MLILIYPNKTIKTRINKMETSKTFRAVIQKYKIEIPEIQRDYAQGRGYGAEWNRANNKERIPGKEEKIIDKFLSDIEKIDPKEGNLDFNFIYGVVKNDKFIPVDGQQRLTLLFLLYWYAQYKLLDLKGLSEKLKNFTYQLRSSAKEFFEKITSETICDSSGKNLSKKIKNNSWFLYQWLQDPTIKSVLAVLDKIDEKFKDDKELVNKLDKITFLFQEIQEADHEDIYIKLNSRGKPLDEFENFKAQLIGLILKEKQDFDVKNFERWTGVFEKLFSDKEKYTNDELEVLIKNTDNAYLNFLLRAFYVEHIKNNGTKNLVEYSAELLANVEKADLPVLGAITDTLTFLNNSENEPLNFLKDFSGKNDENIPTLDKLLHIAVMLKSPKDNKENMADFYDFFKKMIANTEWKFENFINAVKSIYKLSEELQQQVNKNIYAYLRLRQEKTLNGFYEEQYKEEVLKANTSGDLRVWIKEAEKYDYLDGQLASLLVFSKINITNYDLPADAKEIDLDKFKKYFQLLKTVLEIEKNDTQEFLLARALLCFGRYDNKNYEDNYLLRYRGCKSFLVRNKERDISWKTLLSQRAKEKRKYVKDLLDKLLEKKVILSDKESVKQALKEIIKDALNKGALYWCKYFIKDDTSIRETGGNRLIKIIGNGIKLNGLKKRDFKVLPF